MTLLLVALLAWVSAGSLDEGRAAAMKESMKRTMEALGHYGAHEAINSSLAEKDGKIIPLQPFKDSIPEVAKDFYRSLDKEYIFTAKKLVAELTCCHPDSAHGEKAGEGAQCPHAYPNVPDEYTNETTGQTYKNPSDCTCKMSAAKSKARFQITTAAIVAYYKMLSEELDLEGSFQTGMAKSIKNFAQDAKGMLLQQKVRGMVVPLPRDLDMGKSMQIEEWETPNDESILMELVKQHAKKYIPSSHPGVEVFKDIRAMGRTYKATRDVHLMAYKRVVLANRPFQASVDAYVAVVRRFSAEVRRMLEAHMRLGLQGEPLVRAGWQTENPEFAAPKTYIDFLNYLFDRYTIQEMGDLDAIEAEKPSETDSAGLPLGAFETVNSNNQDNDGQYESMEADFSKVYRTVRNKFLRCAIELREVVPSIEATYSAFMPLQYGAPLLKEYIFLGSGFCMKERGPPMWDDTELALERGYTGNLEHYYIRPQTVFTVQTREECEAKCSTAHEQVLAANNPAGQRDFSAEGENGGAGADWMNFEGIETFHDVLNAIGTASAVQEKCAKICNAQKDAGCTSASVPVVHNDSPEGTPILSKGTANVYDQYFLDATSLDHCRSYCWGAYRQIKGEEKGKIKTRAGCTCQESWTTKYDPGSEGKSPTLYNNPELSEEAEGQTLCSVYGDHASGEEWCKVEPNCAGFKGNKGSEGGKLRMIHTDLTDGGIFGADVGTPTNWDDDFFSGQWDYCVEAAQPAFEDKYGNNLCRQGDDWGSYHSVVAAGPSEAEWNSWHGERFTGATSWEDCQGICDKIGTYPEGDALWVFPRLRCGNFYFSEAEVDARKCKIELTGPYCKINLFNCQTFFAGCNGYEYNSEYSQCRIFPPDDTKYHQDTKIPGYGRMGSSEGIHEVLTWDGLDCEGNPQIFNGAEDELQDYKDPWVKALWFPETCPFDEQSREDYARMFMDEEVGGPPSCMKCKYEREKGASNEELYEPYLKQYKDTIEQEMRRYEDGANPVFVHTSAEFEREYYKWECWRRESIKYKDDLWFDKLENGYHQWDWPEHAKHDASEEDEVEVAEDNSLHNDIQFYKDSIVDHEVSLSNKVEEFHECVTKKAPGLKEFDIKPFVGTLSANAGNKNARPQVLKPYDEYMTRMCEHSGSGSYKCGSVSLCELSQEIEVEYGIRNELKETMAHAQANLAAAGGKYVDHQEAWIKPKLREARNALSCIDKATLEYETTTRSYMAFLMSEASEADFTKQRWYDRVKTMVDKWAGASTGLLQRPGRHAGMYQAAREQAESEQRPATVSLKQRAEQHANRTSHDPLGDDEIRSLIPHSVTEAKKQTLLQMTRRIDENAFRIVDYAAIYIETRNAHLEALNDLVLSMGPYLTALKAYSTALKSYSAATLEKSKHIMAVRDMKKNEKILNDAKAIIAFNELKAGASSPDATPHPWCPTADRDCKESYAAAFWKQIDIEHGIRGEGLVSDGLTFNESLNVAQRDAMHANIFLTQTKLLGVSEAYKEDIQTGEYQVLGNPLKDGKEDLYYAFAPYFVQYPPEHWMMKISLELDDDIMVDLVERDYETAKAKFSECTDSVTDQVDAFSKALNAVKVEPSG